MKPNIKPRFKIIGKNDVCVYLKYEIRNLKYFIQRNLGIPYKTCLQIL